MSTAAPQRATAETAAATPELSVGRYLGQRLVEAGLEKWFSVPGDFTLVLMDQLLATPGLEMVCCCNELNAGYAADGYARARGFAAVMVTYTVGGLSVLNAVAGAYSDHLPVLVISGGPNSNDGGDGHLLHHTTGQRDFRQSRRIFREVTAEAIVIDRVDHAARKIDEAVELCLRSQRPVYLEIACNLSAHKIPPPQPRALDVASRSDSRSLEAAVSASAARIEAAVKPVMLVGGRVRAGHAAQAAIELAEALGCAVAFCPDAKGRLPEDHPQVIGMWWGSVSWAGVESVVDSSDLVLALGVTQTDYMTVGWTSTLDAARTIDVQVECVSGPDGVFTNVPMRSFVEALKSRVPKKPFSLEAFRRFPLTVEQLHADADDAALTTAGVVSDLQAFVSPEVAVIAETGDSWFNGQKLHLPRGAEYEWQMQYGSIGWSVPTTLGYALGTGKRVVTLVGDGSFQLTAQEVSTMIRERVDAILILINNGGYTIEVEIHDGPYNKIKNWDYAGLIDVFNAEDGRGQGLKAATGGEFRAALQKALAHRDGPTLIEVKIGRDDCSRQLLEWGARVAAANGRAPRG